MITKQTLCMSFWAKKIAKRFSESKFHRVNNEVKPRSESDDGIWQGVLVTFVSMLLSVDKPPRFWAISLRRFGALLLLVRFAQPAEVRLRASLSAQNDIQRFYLRLSFVFIKLNHRLHCSSKNKLLYWWARCAIIKSEFGFNHFCEVNLWPLAKELKHYAKRTI